MLTNLDFQAILASQNQAKADLEAHEQKIAILTLENSQLRALLILNNIQIPKQDLIQE